MVIFKKSGDISRYLDEKRNTGVSIAYVPTMGALHAGHRSLIARARNDGGITVCSIFVNPTQFNDSNDLKYYPVTTDADIALLSGAGCDVLFLPSVDEIYPGGAENTPAYEFGYIASVLDGALRPGHFRGVGQVVARLLEIVHPDRMYLGQKDFQQCLVLRKLVVLLNLNLNVVVCPTVREPDGLALSSRNRRLTDRERVVAGTIYQCLVSIQSKQEVASFSVLRKECEDLLTAKGLTPEYVALADIGTLELFDEFPTGRRVAVLVAARLGNARLIDNIILDGSTL